MMLGLSEEARICESSWVWGTVSKALEKSIAMATVRGGRRLWLNPEAMVCERGRSEEVVECKLRKPCCESASWREAVMWGSSRRSSTFTAGQRSEIGL